MITETKAANLALIGMKYGATLPRSVNGYVADVSKMDCTESRRLDAISMIERHCPQYGIDARAELAK